jgi:eukaryotic-like serine/threonine-protein kinase
LELGSRYLVFGFWFLVFGLWPVDLRPHEMNSEKWQQVKEVFEAVLRVNADERQAFLYEACDGDSELRAEVESLLSSFDEGFLEKPAVGEVADIITAESGQKFKNGQIIGQYRILAELGKGGQGAVFKAFDAKLNRTVALKTLPPDLTIDESARKRFEREAQLASALDHPNICTIHDLTHADAAQFIVMQFVDGKNVRQLVDGKPLELKSALKIAIQVCDALATAHHENIIHRDIKAQNIIVTGKGNVKILDFGLAKLTDESVEQTELTAIGSPYGTPTYAAPEQSRGEKVDHRADIFSTGVLLYEMLTGTWAFHGKTAVDVRHAVLHDTPKPIAERRGEEIPEGLKAIVDKALAKDPDRRFSTISEMRDRLIMVLRGLSQDQSQTADEFLNRFEAGRPRHFVSRYNRIKKYVAVAAIVLIFLGTAGYFVYRRGARLSQAASDAMRVRDLAKERRYFEAYDLANSVIQYRPDDPTIRDVMPVISDELTVTSNEPGASVYIKRYSPGSASAVPREMIGQTPIEKARIARGEYIIEIEKDGFAPFRRTFSGSPEVYWDLTFNPPPTQIEARLLAVSEVPDRMVFVPGGDYELVSWKKPTGGATKLGDFFIDRYEVSNREFKEFVSAGGYLKKEYWKMPYVRDGKSLFWEAAMDTLKDRTGLPGPRSWSNQTYAEGRANHPVTDVTWYEAAAYAEFRGGSLPSVFQWEKAARNGAITQSADEVMPWGYFPRKGELTGRANIATRDSVPVEANEFGMSPFGCHNMAGNVAEWCSNQLDSGFTSAGGSWGEPAYAFGSIANYPGTFSSNTLGFRCVRNLAGVGPDAAKIDQTNAIPVYKPSTPEQFRQLKTYFRYDKTPPAGRIVETVDTAEWRRERIEYRGANDETALAYLYLPKSAAAPYQVIQYLPAGDVYGGFSTVSQHVETFAASQIRAGRAVFAVVLHRFPEHSNPDNRPKPIDSVRFRDAVVTDMRDLQRGLDYLETRSDIDASRVAFWGYSAGAEFGIVYSAIESRLRGVILMAIGISDNNVRRLDEANVANFAPHIIPPKLILQGRYDEEYSWVAETEPLLKLLAEPKQLVRYDAGHTPPPEIAVPAIAKWLDEKLGPVSR